MNRFLFLGALLGGLGVLAGALGAHALKPLLTTYQLEIYNKAVFYQMIHALFLLWISRAPQTKRMMISGACAALGVFGFSGSLYLLATWPLYLSAVPSWAGPITPIGGVFLTLAWIILMSASLRKQ